MKESRFHRLPFFLFLAILSIVVLSNLIWIVIHQHSPYFDASGHTILTYIFSHVFRGNYPFNGVVAVLQQSNYYPPLMYFIGSLVTLVFGFNYRILQVFSTFLLIPTSLLLYLYTQKMTKNRLWAIFASSLFVLFPVIWEESRHYMLDLPLTMWVLAAVYSLELSKNFKKVVPSALFFVFASFAQLTKWYGFVYLVVPFLFAFQQGWMSHQERAKFLLKQAKYFLLAGIIALPWYLVNFQQLIKDTTFFSHAHYQNPTATFSLQNFLYYPTLMLNFQIVSITFLWLLVSVFLFVKSTVSFKRFLLVQIVFSLLVFTLLGNKNVRFTMPLLPFLAIIMGYGLEKIHQYSRAIAYLFWGILLSFGLLLMTLNSFDFPFKLERFLYVAPMKDWDIFILYDGTSSIIPYHFERTAWSAQNVLHEIEERAKENAPSVYVGVNNEYLSQPIIEVFKFQENSPVNFASPPFDKRESLDTPEKITRYLEPYHYLLIPKDSVGPQHHVNYNNLDNIRKHILSGSTRKYKWVTTYTLPTEEEVYLFELDPDYNRLQIDVVQGKIFIKRPDSPTKVFFQMADENNVWHEVSLGAHQTDYFQSLDSIKTIRIDYPPELWSLYYDENWTYDFDMQIDAVNTSSTEPQ